MASKYCRQCGRPVEEGKRFCAACGKPVAETAEQPTTAAGARKACPRCGHPLAAGKRFCGGCGQALAEEKAPAVAAAAPAPVAETSRRPELPAVKTPASDSAPVAWSLSIPALLEDHESNSSPVPSALEPPPASNRLIANRWLTVAASFVVVAAAAAGFLAYRHRSAPPASASAEAHPDPLPPAPELSPEPKGNVSRAPDPPPPPSRGEDAGRTPSEVPPSGQGQPAPTPPAPEPPTVDPVAAQSNGTRHYSGPPVHFGEVVMFTNLPGKRLRFTFDHTAWQPAISHQADGTQTLRLRSLLHTEQTQCDMRWEILP